MWSVLISTLFACIILLGLSLTQASIYNDKIHFPFQSLVGKSFLSSHEMTEESFHKLILEETMLTIKSDSHKSLSHHYLTCGPMSELKDKRSELILTDLSMTTDHVRTLYQSRSKDLGCLLVHAQQHILETADIDMYSVDAISLNGNKWTYVVIPPFLKIRGSVMNHLKSMSSPLDLIAKPNRKSLGDTGSGPVVESHHIQIELSLGSITTHSVKHHSERLFSLLQTSNDVNSMSSSRPTLTDGWYKLKFSIASAVDMTCSISDTMLKTHGNHIIVTNIE